MIYLKPIVANGTYRVEAYSESGVNITSDFVITSKLYKQDHNKEYVFLLETSEKVLDINPDFFEKEEAIYTTIHVDGALYKTLIKTPVKNNTVTQSYTILYKSHIPFIETSNPFLDRFNYFMPRWSTAYKNDITVFSKITNPLFANIEQSFLKISKIVANSLKETKTIKRVYKPRSPIGKIIDEQGVQKHYVYNIENAPITRTDLKDAFIKERDFFSLTMDTFLQPKLIKKDCSSIFVKSPLNSSVSITGLTIEGVIVEEDFTFNTLVIKQSIYKYRKLISMTSSHPETRISNYIDCSEDHLVEKSELLPLFIDITKEQQYPLLRVVNGRLTTRFVKSSMFPYDGHSYGLNKDVTEVFVTDTLDVITLDNKGCLSTGILRKDIEVDMPLLDNNNNNSYIHISDIDFEEDLVHFTVNTKDVVESLETHAITIKIETDTVTYYLDSVTNNFSEVPVNYVLDNVNALDFSLTIDNQKFISVTIETDKKKFQASFRNDLINLTERVYGVERMYYTNEKIYLKVGSLLKELNTYKDYYEITRDGSIIMYEDNLTIYSLKGAKLDG